MFKIPHPRGQGCLKKPGFKNFTTAVFSLMVLLLR